MTASRFWITLWAIISYFRATFLQSLKHVRKSYVEDLVPGFETFLRELEHRSENV